LEGDLQATAEMTQALVDLDVEEVQSVCAKYLDDSATQNSVWVIAR
jgi:hypothetical protein